MENKSSNRNPIIMLRTAVNSLVANPIILYPFMFVIFIQFLVLEILFFSPRFPLSNFFAPLIIYFKGWQFLHYPYNFSLLVDWFQSEQFQYPLYIFFSSFFLGTAVAIIYTLNSEKTLNFKSIYRQTWQVYVHLIMACAFSACLVFLFSSKKGILFSEKYGLYFLLIKRALLINPAVGHLHIIKMIVKQIILNGAPYLNLFVISFASSLLIYTIPIIIIERKNVFTALWLNFKILKGSFLQIFIMVLLTNFLFVPVILIKANNYIFEHLFSPEISVLILIISIIVTVAIDAIQVSAVTIYYLLWKESNEKNIDFS